MFHVKHSKGGERMNRIFTVNFWVQLFLSTFMTMVMIYLIKKASATVQIPVVKDIVESV